MIPIESIREIWELFIQAESGTTERSTWLDVFIATVLSEKNQGRETSEIFSFCLPGDICTLIGCELFADVHRICSFAGDGEDLSPLQNYLLRGRGWRSLVILDDLGVKGLSCSEELANLLISLYPVCLRYRTSSFKKNPFIFSKSLRKPDCSSPTKCLLKPKSRQIQHPPCIENKGEASGFSSGAMIVHSTGPSPIQSSSIDCSASSESEFLEEEMSLNKANMVKIQLNPMDFDYFTSVIRSDDEPIFDRFHSESKQYSKNSEAKKEKKSPSDYIVGQVKMVLESEVSVLEFCELSMRLLQTLCDTDMESQANCNAKIAVQVLGFVLENLCSLQYGTEIPVPVLLSENEITHLKMEMSWLLHYSLTRILVSQQTTSTIVHNKALATMLRLLEDTLNDYMFRTVNKNENMREKSVDPEEAKDHAEYVHSLFCCILIFLHSTIDMHKLGDAGSSLFLEMLCIFDKSLNGSLVETVISYLDGTRTDSMKEEVNRYNQSLSFQILDLLGSLISKLKDTRMEISLKEGTLGSTLRLNSKRRTLKNRRHSLSRKASSSHLLHHHKTDALGIPGLVLKPGKEAASSCTVSTLFSKLVKLISNCALSLELKVHVVHVATKCGTCCCFPSSNLLDAIANELVQEASELASKKNYRTVCFSLLERTLYPQLWGCILPLNSSSILPTHLCCLNFTDAASRSLLSLGNFGWKTVRHSSQEDATESCEFPSTFTIEPMQGFGSDDNRSQWIKLKFYQKLIESKDFKLCHSTLCHLLRVLSVATPKVMCELLALVIFPTFISAKVQYLEKRCEMAKFRLLSCLSIFSCYIGRCPEFTAAFFDSGCGLDHIVDLIFQSEFSQACCSVLEEIILVGMKRIQEDPTAFTTSCHHIKKLHSNVLLLNSIEYFSEKAVGFLNRGGDYTLDCISSLAEEYLLLDHYTDCLNGLEDKNTKKTGFSVGSDLFAKIEADNVDTLEKALKFSSMFWKACAILVLKSNIFKDFFSTSVVCKKGFLLLQMLVLRVMDHNIFEGETSSANLSIKTIEALVIVNLKCHPIEAENNKMIGETDVMEKLKSLILNMKMTEPSISICHLCDVFIRCATDDCKGRPALLLAKKPELPSLKVMTDGSSSVGGDPDAALEDVDDDDDDGRSLARPSEVYFTADEGYDGDVEVLDMDESPFVWHSLNVMHLTSVPNSRNNNVLNQTLPSRKWSMQNIVYPELCCISLDLLVRVNDIYQDYVTQQAGVSWCEGDTHEVLRKLFDKNSSRDDESSNHSGSENFLESMIQSLQRLTALCRENSTNCVELSKQGIITQLLRGFSSTLVCSDPKLSGLQQIVLDLFTHLARYSITTRELSLYLGFFKAKDPPVESLIQPLSHLMMSTRPQPHFIMCFPVEIGSDLGRTDPNIDWVPHQKKMKPFNVLYHKNHNSPANNENSAAFTLAKNLHDEHKRLDIPSVWALSALALPIDTDIGWSPWNQGFSLSMWLQLGCKDHKCPNTSCGSSLPRSTSNSAHHMSLTSLSGSHSDWGLISERPKDESSCASIPQINENCMAWKPVSTHSALHLFSVGNEMITLEAWANPAIETLTLKLIKTDGKKMDSLCESTVENCLSTQHWHHLAINVKDFMQRRKSVIEVTMFIDGCREVKVLMTFNGLLLRRSTPTCLLLGHTVDRNIKLSTSWYFGNMVLFRCPVFSKERALYLMSMGPNFTQLTDCDVEKQHPNFSSTISSTAILLGIDWEALFEGKNGNLKLLQDNLLITYSAQNCKFLNVYPVVVTNPGGVVGSLFPGQPGFRVVTMDQRASQQLPLGLRPAFLSGPPNLQMFQGLPAAISSLGGTPLFLFLFAQVVEMSASEKCQAKALSLLLKLVQSDGGMFSQFINEDSYKLLIKVLTSSQCQAGPYMLKALLDVSCDKPVLHYHSVPGKFQIVSQSNGIITHPALIVMIIQAWRGWEKFRPQTEMSQSSTIGHVQSEDDSFKMNSPWNVEVHEDDEGGILGIFLRVILTLLRDDHPYREFNAAQLNRVGTVEALLMFCKEHFLLDDSVGALHASVCCSLVEVIRSLMGAPPEFSHIVALSDFLILVHRASTTYITHARSSFHFLLSPTPPPSSSSMAASGSPTSKPPHSHVQRNTPVMPINPAFHKLSQSEVKTEPSVLSLKTGKDIHLAQPVDPQKLNKALTNLQIKQSGDDIENCSKKVPNNISTEQSENLIDSYSAVPNFVLDSNKVTLCKSCESPSNEDHIVNGNEKWKKGFHHSKGKYDYRSSSVAEKLAMMNIEYSSVNLMESLIGDKEFVAMETSNRLKDENQGSATLKEDAIKWKTYAEFVESKSDADFERMPSESERDPQNSFMGRGVMDWSEADDPSQALVVEGLLLLLRDTLLVLPDSMSHQVLNYVVRAETFLVMANHSDSRVRTAVVKVISAFLQRAGDEEANRFLKARGFYLLANQLGQFEATTDLVEACLSLVTRCSASLEDQTDVSLSSTLLGATLVPFGGGDVGLGCLQAAAFPPLLALLQQSIQDIALAHNLMLFLREAYSKVPQASRSLLDSGLLEALAKTLMAIVHQQIPYKTSFENIGGFMEQDLLVSDIHSFLVSIVSHSISAAGAHHMQVINDIQHLLNFMESLEKSSCGPKSHCVSVLRETQVVILNGAIETIQVRMTSIQPHSGRMRSASSILSSVLSTSYEDTNQLDSQNFPSMSSGVDGTSSLYAANYGSLTYPRPIFNFKEIPRNEVNERFKILLQKSVDFIISAEPRGNRYQVSESEMNFARFILSVVIRGLATVLEKNSKGRTRSSFNDHNGRQAAQQRPSLGEESSSWNTFAWAARDCIRIQAGRLLVFLLCPRQPARQRIYVLHFLSEEPYCREILTMILQSHPQVEHRFAVFYQDLLHSRRSSVSGISELKQQPCEDLAEKMESWGLLPSYNQQSTLGQEMNSQIITPSQAMGPEHPLWKEEVSLLEEELEKQRQILEKQNESAQLRSVYKNETLAKSITECALDITRIVVDAQNMERKSFMEHIKLAYSIEMQVKVKWQKIIQQFTHERAVWFFPESYPRSWQLDSTEGPGRVRKRLQRCHLGINKKYVMSEFQHKLDAFRKLPPLSYLFHQEKKCRWPHSSSSTSSVLIERLLMDEKIRHTCTACIISPAIEVPGEILIGECNLYFVTDDSISEKDMWEVTNGSCGLDGCSMAWPLEDVIAVYNRRFQLQERALEIFLVNGKTYLIAFHTFQERDAFVAELSRCQLPNQLPSDNLNDIVQMWREGLITNYEYLTQLNKMAGRSFNDLMQYPVFPFILADYTSETLDLMDSKVFRNLKKPMAVQEKKNENHYMSNYNYLKEELQDVFNSISLNQEPYHYGSHYSNSGTVLHFLVRQPPFTRMFLTYQDQNFDIPDRTFHSLQTTWRLTSTDSTTDVKELIPEFFFLPEFLINSEGFDFGVRQSGERVNNVHLPPWCEGDARTFILVHRQALESDYVRENIHHWIDLVFGYKQTGRAAVEAINVFHPATYYGFDVESIRDPLERIAWETMIKTYGQTPRQLFRSAHPMVVQSLLSRVSSVSVPSVLPFVKGLQWGSYVGSPADPPPRVVWHHQHRTPVAMLIPLQTNDVFGLALSTSILLCYGKSKSLSMLSTTCVLGAALVTWGHSDGIVRVKLRKEQPPWPIIQSSNLDPIWICSSMPDCCQLWVGHSSGKLVVYKYNFSPMKGQLDFKKPPVTLLGHSGGIMSLCICRSFSIAVSASQDGTAIIWDLNNLTYIRSTPNVECPVKLLSVSETMGDIVTVSDEIDKATPSLLSSCIRLYTVNAQLVKRVVVGYGPLQVTSICFSTAPEGVSVNVVAAGLANGAIRLWSTWDLTLIREIICELLTKPIISIAYSHDSQHLYGSSSDGSVVIWEAAGAKGVSKTPKFLNLTSL